jgi:hypothetical protein
MKKLLIQMLMLVSFLGMGQALQFGTLGSGFNNATYNAVRALFYDTVDNKLYAGGQFAIADGKTVWGAAVWQNNAWDSLRGGLTKYPQSPPSQGDGGPIVNRIIRFQNKIYFTGGIEWVNGKNQYNMGVWNGTNWDYPIAEPPNGVIFDLKIFNGTLYACGMFTKFGNTVCNYVAKFDGVSWQTVGDFQTFMPPFDAPAQMNAIAMYNNEIYVGGAFDDATGMVRNLAKFDGTNWVNVGTGIRQGGVNSVFALEEFNGKLYIGGRFGKTQEVPGNNLVMWDGSNYLEVNSFSIGGQLSNFKKHKNKLLVTGIFNAYGTVNAYGHFFVDQNNLGCAITGLESTFNSVANSAGFSSYEFIGDSLIVGGQFHSLDTVSANNIGVITNYENSLACLYVGIKENAFNGGLIKVYPNPVKEKLNVEFSVAEIREIKLNIINAFGQTVYTSNVTNQLEEIDLSLFKSGMYFLKIQSNSEQKVFKIIKE